MIRRFVLLFLLPIVLLISCSTPMPLQPPPTPEIVTVAVDPAVWPLREALQVCSGAYPDLLVSLQEISPDYPGWESFDLYLRMGEPDELPAFAAPLGVEQVSLVINAENPVKAINEEDLNGIFSGRITRWSDIGGPFRPVQVWVYPEGDAAMQVFKLAVMSGNPITSHALLAPNATAMLEAISGDPNSIGLIPHAWLQESVRELEIDPDTLQALSLPVLAMAESEPAEAAGEMLYCLQQGDGLVEVLRLYEK